MKPPAITADCDDMPALLAALRGIGWGPMTRDDAEFVAGAAKWIVNECDHIDRDGGETKWARHLAVKVAGVADKITAALRAAGEGA
jgi:hypothetical protein